MSAARELTRGFRTVEIAAAKRRVKSPYSRACRALSPTGTVPGSGIGAGRDDAMKITTAYATVANQRTTALPLRIRSLALRSRTRRLELRAALRASIGVRWHVGPAIRAHEPGFARRLAPLAAGRAGAPREPHQENEHVVEDKRKDHVLDREPEREREERPVPGDDGSESRPRTEPHHARRVLRP